MKTGVDADVISKQIPSQSVNPVSPLHSPFSIQVRVSSPITLWSGKGLYVETESHTVELNDGGSQPVKNVGFPQSTTEGHGGKDASLVFLYIMSATYTGR